MRYIRTASALTAAALAASLAVTTSPASAAPPPAYVTISGAGTSWPSVAIDQWAQDLRSSGLVVNYNPAGSAAGRVGYIQDQYDFGASDPPFRSGEDKLGNTGREIVPWGYSYVPDVAGGTAFLYHIDVNGHQYTNLKLTGKTLMEIFTGQITNWDNPQITKDTGTQLPNLPITPVVHSEGAGDTWFFSQYLATVFPSQWNAFCDKVHPGIKPPCGPTEFYPANWGNVKAELGSALVASYISSSVGDGAIGYDEYTYALNSHLPAVAMGNAAGKYVLPTAANVSTALTRAIINENPQSKNFLQQDLSHVYANPAPASYPLAGYSYVIVPRSGTKIPPIFTRAAGRSLSAFLRFALSTAGQAQLIPLGYAPLPAALVKGGLQQIGHIPGS